MNDLISRADAIETVKELNRIVNEDRYETVCTLDVLSRIEKLPSAELVVQTPQTYGKSINPSNAEVVADYISRADAIEAVASVEPKDKEYHYYKHIALEALKALPSAEAVSREEYEELYHKAEEVNDMANDILSDFPSYKKALSAEATCATCADRAMCIMSAPDGNWKACKDYRPSAEAVSREFYEDVVKANHGLAKENSELKEQIESAEAEWIPCSERLPSAEDCPMDCMVTRRSKYVGNYTDMAVAEADGTWTHEDWKAIAIKGEATCISTRDADIIAWMPLPKPYREDGEKE